MTLAQSDALSDTRTGPEPILKVSALTPRGVALAIVVIAVGMSLFQMYGAGVAPLGLFYQRTIHLGFVMVLAFLLFPVFGENRSRGVLGWVIDGTFLVMALMTGG